MEDVQKLLHAARETLGLSQAELADATGVSSRTLHRMENQVGIVRFETLEVLREFYDRSGLKLLSLDGGKKWALLFSDELAPAPSSAGAAKLYDPVPGLVLKAARILIGMTQEELSRVANMAHTTVRRLEKLDPKVSPEKAYELQKYLEKCGIQFQKPEDGVGWIIQF